VGVKRLEGKTGFPPSNRHTNLCGICPFREARTVYQHLLRDNYYRYPSWEAYYAQRKTRLGWRQRGGGRAKLFNRDVDDVLVKHYEVAQREVGGSAPAAASGIPRVES
jgi:hypothetical protein